MVDCGWDYCVEWDWVCGWGTGVEGSGEGEGIGEGEVRRGERGDKSWRWLGCWSCRWCVERLDKSRLTF